MRSKLVSGILLVVLVATGHWSQLSAETIGSPLVHRQFTDIDSGQLCIYDGTSSPFQTAGDVTTWSFFDDRNTGRSVTPLIFQITSGFSFSLVGIGTTRVSDGSGLQSFPFGLIAGSNSVIGGGYTFGFTNRAYSVGVSGLTPGTSNNGLISFDRPSQTIPVDRWYVTAGATTPGPVSLQIGSIVGTGGITIYNPQDPGGFERVYSAQMTVPEPATGSAILTSVILVLSFRSRPRKT